MIDITVARPSLEQHRLLPLLFPRLRGEHKHPACRRQQAIADLVTFQRGFLWQQVQETP
jgi:hypothetical protein